jgi:membrane protease YdiL (CAAX protease family)
MRQSIRSYLAATCHPWSSALFLLPLLLAYEAGVLVAGDGDPEALRNGADTWLRWGLQALGLVHLYWAPVLLIGLLLLWSWMRRDDRPREHFGVLLGMALESGLFAMGLWGVSRGLSPLLNGMGIPLESTAPPDPAVEQVISFVGAGIYEETLFRLLLFSGLVVLFRFADVPVAAILAGVTSSLVFAAAHNVGPHGEPFAAYVFFFRTLAGLYFSVLYRLRGFGIAVGAHAGYDVLVGVLVQS